MNCKGENIVDKKKIRTARKGTREEMGMLREKMACE